MKKLLLSLCLFFCVTDVFSQNTQKIVTYDIDNFWIAYDKVISTKDKAQQLNYLNRLFIEKGSPGLRAIMKARNYTDQSYLNAINNYPLFWGSIRPNMNRVKAFASQIENNTKKLGVLYPSQKQSTIYFTVGALRTGGTTLDGMVLIGSEIALADKSTITTELPSGFSHLRAYFDSEPIKDIVFLIVHEYVHTQQKTTIGDNLLAQSVLEGIAEFVAELATEMESKAPSIIFGKANSQKVKEKFVQHMFNPFSGFWLYSNAENEFSTRDLGYYIGYAISQKYYAKSPDKKLSIKEMIELDYNNQLALFRFVDKSEYFDQAADNLLQLYESSRPNVTEIKQFTNGIKNVSPRLTEVTINFSSQMDDRHTNFELGPLGKENALQIKRFVGFSQDKKSATFEIELIPNKRYQLIVGSGFRSAKGVALKPYLLDFTTVDM